MNNWTSSTSASPETHLPSTEPEPSSEPVPEAVPSGHVSSIAEPLPQWDLALRTWQWVWPLHWAGIGSLFVLMALYATWSIIIMSSGKNKRRQPLSLVINILLVILGLTRALFLFINPYESEQCYILPNCPMILTRLLFGLGLPCFTASFSLIHLTFLQLTKLTLYPAKLQSIKVLICVISIHFGLAIITEVIMFTNANWRWLTIVCQGFFILFCLLLSTSFIYSGRKVIKYARQNSSRMQRLGGRLSTKRSINNGNDNSGKEFRPNMTKLVKITYFTTFLGFAGVILQLYAIFGVYNMFTARPAPPRPWSWFAFESLFRIVEVLAGCTMAYVGRRQVRDKSLYVKACMLWVNRSRGKRGKLSPYYYRESDTCSVVKTGESSSACAVEAHINGHYCSISTDGNSHISEKENSYLEKNLSLEFSSRI